MNILKIYPLGASKKNHLAYYRLLLAQFLPINLKRCLYLDVDMLCLCDLRELFAIDLKDKFAAVVLDCSNPYEEKRWKSRKNDKDLVLKHPKKYFNSGFILFNNQMCLKFDIEKKFFDFLKNYHTIKGDQDVINVAFGNNTLKLLPKWNFFILHFFGDDIFYPNVFLGEDKKVNYGYTRQDYEKSLKDIKIIHFTWGQAKPWDNVVKFLNKYSKPICYPYYKKWWDYALDTPIFKDELRVLQNELKENALIDYANTFGERFTARERVIYETIQALQNAHRIEIAQYEAKCKQLLILIDPKLESAAVRVRNQLSYRLGKAIIANSKSFIGYLKLPFALLKAFLIYKKKEKIYKARISYNLNLKLPPLESYPDFNEALKIKNHLSYKLGSAFLKGLKTWYKLGLLKFYFTAKKLEREFKENKRTNKWIN